MKDATRSVLTLALLLMPSLVARAQISLSEVQKYIDANRPQGFGPGQVIAGANGKLTGYGRHPDTAILYGYQIGESRDRSGGQYLVVFRSTGEGYRPTQPRLVAADGVQYLNDLSINGMTITLRGKAWGPNDPHCCPSEAISVHYVVVNDELIAKGYSIK
jgi:hypothetical protein